MHSDNIIFWKTNEKTDLELEIGVYSIWGNRNSQQDFAAIMEKKDELLAVVCDGMGGLNGGERASQAAVSSLTEAYRRQETEVDGDFLQEEALTADEKVAKLKNEKGDYLRAGTTMAAVVVKKGCFECLSVGDSRIYLLRNGRLHQISVDHNYKEQLNEDRYHGKITEEFYQREVHGSKAEALTSYIGMNGLKRIGRSDEKELLQESDQILICSDGLYKSLSFEQIEAMMCDNAVDMTVSSRRLIRMALEQAIKKQDNTTAILIQYKKKE